MENTVSWNYGFRDWGRIFYVSGTRGGKSIGRKTILALIVDDLESTINKIKKEILSDFLNEQEGDFPVVDDENERKKLERFFVNLPDFAKNGKILCKLNSTT